MGRTRMPELRPDRRRRRLLPELRRPHHGQGPQPVLQRPPKEAPSAGGGQTLQAFHSTAALPITPPAVSRQGRGASGLLEDQGCGAALPEGGGQPADGARIPFQCLCRRR